jgi:hypothetical protein
LKEEGIDKGDQLSRDEFLAHAWEWKEKHGGIILEQLKKLGASPAIGIRTKLLPWTKARSEGCYRFVFIEPVSIED